MKRYLAIFSTDFTFTNSKYKNTVKTLVIENETPKMFFWKGNRYHKESENYSYHKTYKEAHAALLDGLNDRMDRKVQEADELLGEASKLAEKVQELMGVNLKVLKKEGKN